MIGCSFFSVLAFSQDKEDKILLLRAQEQAFSNPDESVKIANHLLKKVENANIVAAINLVLANSYFAKGDYNKQAAYIFEAGKDVTTLADSLKLRVIIAKAELSGTLHLYKQFLGYTHMAQKVLDGYKNGPDKNAWELKLKLAKMNMNLQRQKYAEVISLVYSDKNLLRTLADHPKLGSRFYIASAIAQSGLEEYAGAEQNLLQSLTTINKVKPENKILKIAVLNGLSNVYFQRNEYARAIDTLMVSLYKAERLENNYLLEDIYNQLANNYLALNNREEHQKYNTKFISLITLLEEKDSETINSVYTLMTEEQEALYAEEESRLKTYTLMALAAFCLLVTGGILLYFRNKSKRRRLKEVLSYLEFSGAGVPLKSDIQKVTSKKISIPAETEQAILTKLKRFENSVKYLSKDMSLATLAAQLDINTKYLSEVINKHYGDNFNTYINKLRINYIIEKLKNEPGYLNYKISYLAEESGFSSHSTFATVFKSITGIAPTTFIELLSQEVNAKSI